MRALVLEKVPAPAAQPLAPRDMQRPRPGPDELLIAVAACGVCRTELDQIDGRIAPPLLPVVPGHQAVGTVVETGAAVTRFRPGDRAGATWLFSSCGACHHCRRGDENLCPEFRATDCHTHGGYAEYLVMPERNAVQIPDELSGFSRIAPFMCAGAVGYRSLRLSDTEDGMTLGLFGFGSAHHLVLAMARAKYPARKVFVFTRNPDEQALALELGADWAGGIHDEPPSPLDRAIDTTPAWRPVLAALERLRPGGMLTVNAIRKAEADKNQLLSLDYARHLWMEKRLRTVANVTRRDAEEFLALAASARIEPVVQTYPLEQANDALAVLRAGRIRGSKVLTIASHA
ncbi:MAG: zinc-binding alcohol dehydrogenase family protein [SAR202 cluster bacterium]|nr:zinc-binding alcohol dehydrogenase family protein [SAR202 cluster bacterium]